MDFGEVMRTFFDDKENRVQFFENDDFPKKVESLTQMYQLYSAGIKGLRAKLEILDSEFMLGYDHNPIHHIEYRLKSPTSIQEKLDRKSLPLTVENVWKHVNDVAGVRVICSFLEDIYHVSGLLLAQSDVSLVRKKDYIVTPKDSGYRSLHLVVAIPIYLSSRAEHVQVEVQFRTIAMDFWASLEHQLKYKSHKDIPQNLRDELLECSNSISKLDRQMQGIHQKINMENK